MPINVPVYDEPKVAQRPIPAAGVNPSVSAADITGGVEKGIGAIADVAHQQAQQEREQQESARLMDAYSRLGGERLNLEAEIRQVKGADALKNDIGGAAQTRLQQAAAAIEADLPDARTKLRFRQMYLQEGAGLQRAATGHTLQQAEAVKDDARRAAVAIALKKAETAADPIAFEAAKQEGLSALSSGGEPVEAAKVAFLADVDKLERGGMARARAVELEAKHKGDLRAAIEEAQGIENVALSDAVVARLEQRNHQKDNAQADFDKQGLGRITSRIENSRGAWDRGTDPDYDRLSDWARGQVDSHLAQVRRHRDSMQVENRRLAAEARRAQAEANRVASDLFDALPLEQRADLDLRTGLLADGSRIDPETAHALAGVDPAGYAHILARQRGVKGVVAKGRSVEFSEFTARVKEVTAGIDDDDRKTAVTAELQRRFFAAVDKDPTGAPPGAKEVNGWIADAVLMYDVPWGKDRSGAELRAAGKDPGAYRPLPAEDQVPAAREAAARGLAAPPTSAASGDAPHDLSRPILRNADGSWSTVKTVHFPVTKEGKQQWVVAASIWGGKEHSEDQTREAYLRGEIPAIGVRNSEPEAGALAQKFHEEEQQLRGGEAARGAAPAALPSHGPRALSRVEDIPAAERAQIEAAVRGGRARRGEDPKAPVDPAEILRRYNVFHGFVRP